MVGEGITGTLRLTAIERIDARKAALRLVGLRLDEVTRSREDRDSDGHVTHSEHWVETSGKLFIEDAFPEPAIPASLEPGATFEARFAVPAPRLGPPTAHLGESIIAWALEVRWDVPMGSDHFVAVYLPLAQHPDLLRAGVGKQGGMSLLAGVPVGDAMISVTSPLPAPAGSEMAVNVRWPSAPGGHEGRAWSSTGGRTPRTGRRGSSPRCRSIRGAGGRHRRAAGDPGRLRALVRRGRPGDHLRHPGAGRSAAPQRRRDRAAGRHRLTGTRQLASAIAARRLDEEVAMKVLALGRDTAPADDPRFPEVRPAEARRAWELYQQDVIREIYFRADRPNGVLVLEVPDLAEARAVIDSLPLVAAGLIDFDLVPLKPYPGFARLFAEAAPGV